MPTQEEERHIQNIRKDYTQGAPLDEGHFAPFQSNPLTLLDEWLKEAIANNAPEPNAISLATVGPAAEGYRPSCRIVLLRGIGPVPLGEGKATSSPSQSPTADGLHFFTNYESRKGHELDSHPFAAATLFWPSMERQIRIEGTTARLTPQQSDAYYHTRPQASRIGAWASPQSQVLTGGREQLESLLAEKQGHLRQLDEVPRPDFWGGYGLVPLSIEFWQGRRSRLHDRLRFRRDDVMAPWVLERLAP